MRIALYFFALVAVLSLPVSGQETVAAKTSNSLSIGAYYYPWYGASDKGNLGWMSQAMRGHLKPQQLPKLGVYSSRDSKVIGDHIAQSVRAGLDFWAVSWWGPGKRDDRALREHILKHPDAGKLKYAILYESTGRLGSMSAPKYDNLLDDFSYMKKNYFEHPSYLKIDGKPVVFIYLTRVYFRDRGLDELAALRNKFPELYLIGDDVFGERYHERYARLWDAVTAYDIYGQSMQRDGATQTAVDQLRGNYENAKKLANGVGAGFIPGIAPGYNDKAVRKGHVGRARYFTDKENSKDGDIFRTMIKDVAIPLADPKADRTIMITSFNEWYEDTQIEATKGGGPTTTKDDSDSGTFYTEGDRYVDYGTLYLDILREEKEAAAALSKKVIPSGKLVDETKNYHFDAEGISRKVLENYLERSVTMAFYLVPEKPEGRRVYPYHQDDARFIQNIGAKFIGRAIYRWGGESRLNSQEFWTTAQSLIEAIHKDDPEVIFQGCLFEIVTRDVDKVKIPAWVFEDFGLPVEDRPFSYEAMLNDNGKFVNHWRQGSSVPDVSRVEAQLWFYYLAGAYMKIGCEAFHLGQIELIGMNDPKREAWVTLLRKIRKRANVHARRHWVLLDAHTPRGGMIKDGVSLIDFNSFPLRIKEIPEKQMEGVLEVNHLDALYKKSKGGFSPSGWQCESVPYLVEFDNFGQSGRTNIANLNSHFVWGWDEISWFAQQDEKDRNTWLKYARDWIRKTDSNGHLQMPGCRMLSCPNETSGSYRANTKSPICPIGYSQEETIKKLWLE